MEYIWVIICRSTDFGSGSSWKNVRGFTTSFNKATAIVRELQQKHGMSTKDMQVQYYTTKVKLLK